MSGDPINVEGGSSVSLSRIGKISTHEVQDMELERIDSLVAAENQALGFMTFTGGVFISSAISWATATGLSATATATYYAAMGCSFLATMWSAISWRRAKKERPRLLATVRERSRIAENQAQSLPPIAPG